jgi:plastocyanin
MTNTDPRLRRFALSAGLSSLLIALAACTSGTSSSAPATSQTASQSTAESAAASESAKESEAVGPKVTITTTASFGVDEITVPAGEQLTVANGMRVPHTFTEGENGTKAADARVNEQIEPGEQEVIDFPEPGDYHITCLIHAVMNLVVHVE